MCNKNKITARKEETHAEVTDSQLLEALQKEVNSGD